MTKEETIHQQLCAYIRAQYPTVIFTSEPSGLRLPIGQATKLKKLRSGSKLPDLWILERRANYGGLFIELKTNYDSLYKKNGEYKTPHVKEQAEVIERLKEKGYAATFAVGFDGARMEVDMYLLQDKPDLRGVPNARKL
jgi:hypothetical protein